VAKVGLGDGLQRSTGGVDSAGTVRRMYW